MNWLKMPICLFNNKICNNRFKIIINTSKRKMNSLIDILIKRRKKKKQRTKLQPNIKVFNNNLKITSNKFKKILSLKFQCCKTKMKFIKQKLIKQRINYN